MIKHVEVRSCAPKTHVAQAGAVRARAGGEARSDSIVDLLGSHR